MKLGLWFIVFLIGVNYVFSQQVIVFDKSFNIPIPGVQVYSYGYNDTLQTNRDGEVNINAFPADSKIIFSFPPYFLDSKFTKDELSKMHNNVYLGRSMALIAMTPSKITAREYSADLPFFVDIINLDDNSTLQTDDANAGGRVSVTSEKGISVFRSLEPNKMLLVIDGIRLNDEIHRNGKVEGLLNFDKVISDRVQQIYGSSFSIYSSDATGGVIQYFTRMPPTNGQKAVKFEYNSKYISASNSYINNANLMFSSASISSFSSFSYGNYGDVTMGKNRRYVPDADSLYGLKLHYIQRQGDSDVLLSNPYPYRQKGTNYEQKYFFQKLRIKLNSRMNLFLNFHYVNTSDVDIYSGITEINFDHYRFSECRFEPQNKYIVSANLLLSINRSLYDFISINTSYITYNEYRITRKFNNLVELDQKEKLDVYNFNADFVKLFNVNRMVYGVSYQYNKLISDAFFKNIETDSIWQGMNRYPTNGSYSNNASVYWGFKILGSRIVMDLGLRYDFKNITTNFDIIAPQLPLTFTQKEYFSHNPTASLSLSSFLFPWLQTKLIVSATTRAPIIDDFGKIMVKNFIVTIPTDNLRQEKTLSSELGLNITSSENFKLYGSVFLSRSIDAVILKDTVLKGEDSLYFGSDRYNIATNVNIPNTLIMGSSSGFYYKQFFNVNDNIFVKFNGSINFVQGINLADESVLPNISPTFGSFSVQYNHKLFLFGINTQFNGAKKLEDLSVVGEDYIEKAASTGFLPWHIYNVRINYQMKDYAKVSVGVNNIFDLFYRRYSTALASPGRSFVFSVKFAMK